MTLPTLDDEQWNRLARWLAGELAPGAAAEVEAWLAAHPEEHARLLAMREASAAMAPAVEVDVEAAWQRTAARLGEAGATPVTPLPVAREARPVWRWLAMAAALALVAANLWYARKAGRDPEITIGVTGPGRRDSVVFEDGSKVVLGPGSRIELRGRDGRRPTEAVLEGEAYFDWPHDAAQPIRITAGGTTITDLGTRFTVRHAASGAVEVAVHEGRVGFATGGTTGLELAAGQVGRSDGHAAPALAPGAAETGVPAWTTGTLALADADVAELRDRLLRWYGVVLLVPDSALGTRHVTATFAGEAREEVLRALGLSLGATVTWRGDTAELVPVR